LQKSCAFGVFAIGLSLSTHTALADTPLPNLSNLNFLTYTGTNPKDTFANVKPTGWTGGSGLIFIATSGTSAADPNTPCGSTYLQTYGCPSHLAISGGYNVVEADGNPQFESGFNYLITGLTPGTTYSLSFYQAAGQQTTFTGATTEQWIVSLGTAGLTSSYDTSKPQNGCPGNICTYSNADPNATVVATSLMNTPSQGMTDWNFVTVSLKADSTTDLLSFLAWGNNGSTVNLPPMLFLTGVNSQSGLNTPEPGSLVLFGTLIVGIGLGVAKRRKATV
jgi:hypothetical protein